MNDDLYELKYLITGYLQKLEELIILHPANRRDIEFEEMIKKAIYYRDILKRIDEQLND